MPRLSANPVSPPPVAASPRRRSTVSPFRHLLTYSHRPLLALAATLTGILTACEVGPNYSRPELPVATTFKSAATQNAGPVHLATNWWVLFGDPELTRLEEATIRNNYSLKAAMERVAEARAASKLTRSQYYPTITLDPSATVAVAPKAGGNKNDVTSASDVRIPFDLNYEIDIWGRVARALEAANANVRFSIDDYAVVMQTLEADVAQDYMNLRSFDRQAEIIGRSAKLYRDQLNLTKRKQQAGLAGGLDVAQAQALLDQTEAQVYDLRRQAADQVHALAVLTGQPPADFSVGPPLVEMQVPVIPIGLPSELLRHRPDVAEAEQNVVAANASVGVAMANFYPAVKLSGSAGFAQLSLANAVWGWQDVLLTFTPSVTIPIFDGSLEPTLEQAQARYRELVGTYRNTLLTALQDVETNLTDVNNRTEALTAQARSVTSSREYLRLARIEYDQGIISLLQQIDADRSLLTAEQTEEQLRNNRLISTVLLIKALGGGWEDPAQTQPATTEPVASGASAPARMN
jgi:multidrug efflux system outer membrane protein